jgi:hypothetical protein
LARVYSIICQAMNATVDMAHQNGNIFGKPKGVLMLLKLKSALISARPVSHS